MLTGLRKGDYLGHVRHKDPTLKLELVVLVPRFWRVGFVLIFLATLLLIRVYFLAAQQNVLEEVNLILRANTLVLYILGEAESYARSRVLHLSLDHYGPL